MMERKAACQLLKKIVNRSILAVASYNMANCDTYLDMSKDDEKIVPIETLVHTLSAQDLLANSDDYLVFEPSNRYVHHFQNQNGVFRNIIIDLALERQAYRDFRQQVGQKNYLFSVLVGDVFYDSVKTALIDYVKLIIDNEKSSHWQAKIITHDNLPFHLISILVTNCKAMQIVNLGYNIHCCLTTINQKHGENDEIIDQLDAKQFEKISQAFLKLTYVANPQDLKEVFRQQVVDVNQEDLEPTLDKLNRMAQVIITDIVDDHNSNYFEDYHTSFNILTLDNILSQSRQFYFYDLDHDVECDHPETKPMIHQLLKTISN